MLALSHFGRGRDLGGLCPRSRPPERPARQPVFARPRALGPPAVAPVVVRARAAPRALSLHPVDSPAAPAHEVADELAALDPCRITPACGEDTCPARMPSARSQRFASAGRTAATRPSSTLARLASTSSTLCLIIGSPPVVRGRGVGGTAGPFIGLAAVSAYTNYREARRLHKGFFP